MFLHQIYFEGPRVPRVDVWFKLTTAKEIHFPVKSRTRLMGFWCTMSGHKPKLEKSHSTDCFGEVTATWLILHSLVQVCVLWNRKKWVTSELWEDGCRHCFYSTLPHLCQTGFHTTTWMSNVLLSACNLNSPSSAFIIIQSNGGVFLVFCVVKEKASWYRRVRFNLSFRQVQLQKSA